MAKRGSMVVNMAIEGFESMASELASLKASLDASRAWFTHQAPTGNPCLDERWLLHSAGGEDALRDALVGKRQADERRSRSEGETYAFGRQWRIGVDWGTPSAAPVDTEGDLLARFFATSAHEGHEQVRAEPERDEVSAMNEAPPPAVTEGHDDPRSWAVFFDWVSTCVTVKARLQADRDLAAALARIPDDFDLLPDAD